MAAFRLPRFSGSIAPWASNLVGVLESLLLSLDRKKQDKAGIFILGAYSVLNLPDAAVAGNMIYVSDAIGGGIPCFSRGNKWIRVDDNTQVA
jgi:hypothetical protein